MSGEGSGALQSVNVGAQGLVVSRIGFGCLGLAGVYGSVERSRARRTLEHAVDLGVRLFDTADVYGPFTNEQLVGEALASVRDDVGIATKVGVIARPDGSRIVDGSPTHVRRACEASLQRLGVDHIDLYYLHRVDPKVPIEETIGAMSGLAAEGKVRYLGLSEASAATIRRAHAAHPITAVQSEYSLFERGVEAEVLPALRELGIGLVAFSPLGRGLLTGKLGDFEASDGRRNFPRFQPGNLERNLERVDVIRDLADAHGRPAGQIALAWLLARGDDVVPIPGTRNVSHLRDNVGAHDLVLSDQELDQLERAFPPGAAAGARYPPDFLARLDARGDESTGHPS